MEIPQEYKLNDAEIRNALEFTPRTRNCWYGKDHKKTGEYIYLREVTDDDRIIAEAAVAKAKPLIEKQAREEGYVRGRQDIIQRIDNLFGSQLSGYEWNNLLAELGQSLRESKK